MDRTEYYQQGHIMTHFHIKTPGIDGKVSNFAIIVAKSSLDMIVAELDRMATVKEIDVRSQMLHHYGNSLEHAESEFFNRVGMPIYFGTVSVGPDQIETTSINVERIERSRSKAELKSGLGMFQGPELVIVWSTCLTYF